MCAELNSPAPTSAAEVRTALLNVLGDSGLGLLADNDVRFSSQGDGDVVFDMLLTRDLADNINSNEAAFILGVTFARFVGQGVPDDPVQWCSTGWIRTSSWTWTWVWGSISP